jgi:hypothetical protein
MVASTQRRYSRECVDATSTLAWDGNFRLTTKDLANSKVLVV